MKRKFYIVLCFVLIISLSLTSCAVGESAKLEKLIKTEYQGLATGEKIELIQYDSYKDNDKIALIKGDNYYDIVKIDEDNKYVSTVLDDMNKILVIIENYIISEKDKETNVKNYNIIKEFLIKNDKEKFNDLESVNSLIDELTGNAGAISFEQGRRAIEDKIEYIFPTINDFKNWKIFYNDNSASFKHFCTVGTKSQYNWPVNETIVDLVDEETRRTYAALWGSQYVMADVCYLFKLGDDKNYQEFSSIEEAENYVANIGTKNKNNISNKNDLDNNSVSETELSQKDNKYQIRYDELVSKSNDENNTNLQQQFDDWDKLLNDVYQHLKANMSSSKFEELKSDEKNWIKEKENAMSAEANDDQKLKVAIKYTKERCEYLISLVK